MKKLLGTSILAVSALGLGGCNLTASQSAAQAAASAGGAALGSVTPGNLANLGIDSAQAQAFAEKVQKTATAACAFEPSFDGIAALVAAAYPPASAVLSVSKIAGLACTAYKNRIAINSTATYTALDASKKAPATKTAPKKPEPKPGEEVEGVVNVNGRMVVVPGVKK